MQISATREVQSIMAARSLDKSEYFTRFWLFNAQIKVIMLFPHISASVKFIGMHLSITLIKQYDSEAEVLHIVQCS